MKVPPGFSDEAIRFRRSPPRRSPGRQRQEREYEVATFWWPRHDHNAKPGDPPVYMKNEVLCYLRERNPHSGGRQIIYKVMARSGPEAKAKAKRLRQQEGP